MIFSRGSNPALFFSCHPLRPRLPFSLSIADEALPVFRGNGVRAVFPPPPTYLRRPPLLLSPSPDHILELATPFFLSTPLATIGCCSPRANYFNVTPFPFFTSMMGVSPFPAGSVLIFSPCGVLKRTSFDPDGKRPLPGLFVPGFSFLLFCNGIFPFFS